MGLTKLGNKIIAKKMFGSKEVIKEVLNGVTIYTSEEPKSDVAMLVERSIVNVDRQLTNEITFISGFAFAYCTYLQTITIPSSVTNIQSQAFRGCISLINVNLYLTESTYKPPSSSLSWFIDCNSNCIIHIPASVTDPVSAYGEFWNCYDSNDNTKRLTYYNDL